MSDIFGRQLRKQTARAKEKLLEGLGKAKATQDDVFDQHAANLGKQSKACDRLQRDLKAYGIALKAMIQAQKTLRETIRDLYEADWPDREHVCALTQSLDLQWDDFEKVVNEQLMGSVNTYMAQFVDLKAKVAKRGRKLVDFDSARNNYNTVKASSKKGDEDPKVVKAAADLQQAETMYKDLNKELVDTLPATYDSRITFFVDTLQTLFNAESANHNECAKYNKTLVTHLDSLGNAFDTLRVPRPEPSEVSSHPVSDLSNGGTNQSHRDSVVSAPVGTPRRPSPPLPPSVPSQAPAAAPTTESIKPDTTEEEKMRNQMYPSLNASQESAAVKGGKETTQTKPKAIEKDDESAERTSQNPFEENADTASTNPFDEVEEEQPTTPTAKTRSTEVKQEASQDTSKTTETRKVMYKVRATHHYTAEDVDELTFDAGEVIAVLESKEEDLLDEGWLLGIKQSDGVEGVFPANFTKQI
uniref:Bridging integrator 2 n=1 Tax=Ascaris suum TaxID=6253 RepID=F1L176_ASCSU